MQDMGTLYRWRTETYLATHPRSQQPEVYLFLMEEKSNKQNTCPVSTAFLKLRVDLIIACLSVSCLILTLDFKEQSATLFLGMR